MNKLITGVAAALLLASTAAIAQTTTTDPEAATPPTAAPAPAPSPAPAVKPAAPETRASDAAAPSSSSAALILSDDQVKELTNKVIYSSDDKNIGEVAAVARDSSGKVTELHADIGGFLGLGETRVRVMPSEFKLMTDRVILSMTAEEAKALPPIDTK